MVINEGQLKRLVQSVLKELEAEAARSKRQENRQKLYMVCTSGWDERYKDFLDWMEQSGQYEVSPVIPDGWREKGYEAVLKQYQCCSGIRYHSGGRPADAGSVLTVLPVTPRDTIVKTALCISDTFDTVWVANCLEEGSQVILLRSGLKRFSGKEPLAYINQMLSYYRRVLEYGIEICSLEDLPDVKDAETTTGNSSSCLVQPEPKQKKRRIITASQVEGVASDGMIILRQGDIVTDLAKDRARSLNIAFK